MVCWYRVPTRRRSHLTASSESNLLVRWLLQVADFAAVTEALATRMQSEGPGLPSVQLSVGVELLRSLQAELDGLGKQQEELRLAEQLFGMDITSFPHLSKVRQHCTWLPTGFVRPAAWQCMQ